MKRIILSCAAFAVSSTSVLACKADEAHNRKYHGDPKCSQCTCLHHHDDHGDDSITETQILISLEDVDAVSPAPSAEGITTIEQIEVSE